MVLIVLKLISSMSSFGSMLGAGLASNLFSFGLNSLASSSMMEEQNELNRQNWKYGLLNGPMYQMEGYRKAGINPLLALGHSAESIAAVGNQQAAQVDFSSALQAALQAKQLDSQAELAKSQSRNLDADTANKELQGEYQSMVNKVFPQKSEQEKQKMVAEVAYLRQQAQSLQLDNNTKEQLAKGNDYWKKKIGNGAVYNALYQLGNGNVAEGFKVSLSGLRTVVKDVVGVINLFSGLGSVEKMIEKVVQGANGNVVGRTLTHIIK